MDFGNFYVGVVDGSLIAIYTCLVVWTIVVIVSAIGLFHQPKQQRQPRRRTQRRK